MAGLDNSWPISLFMMIFNGLFSDGRFLVIDILSDQGDFSIPIYLVIFI